MSKEPERKTAALQAYSDALHELDKAVCEAMAVSQATATRYETPAIGTATHVFARVCAHSQHLIRASPKSRWVRREYELWDISAIAPHARSILEGCVLFRYLIDAPSDLDTQRTYINVLHLYDCKKRISILPHILPADEIAQFKELLKELRARLEKSSYFNSLDAKIKRRLLNGDIMMTKPRAEVLSLLGVAPHEHDFYWNYLSQYTHVLAFSFHRIETNGRGTGLENDFDRTALTMVLDFVARIMSRSIDRMVQAFPDAASSRQGVQSKFSPGPRSNLPRSVKRRFSRRGRP